MYPKHYFAFAIFMFKIGGYYDPNYAKTNFLRRFHRAYNLFVYASCPIYYSTVELLMLYYTSRSSLYVFVDHVGMIFVHVVGTIKLVFLLTNMKLIKKVMRIIKDIKYESYGEFQPGNIFLAHCTFTSRICYIYIFVGSLIPLINQFKASIKFIDQRHQLEVGNVTCKEIMPYYSVFPFGSATLNWCIVEFIVQSIPMNTYVYLIGAFDVNFVFMLAYLRAHFHCIRGTFETIRERCLVRLGLPEDYETIVDSENPKLEAEIQMEVLKVTKHMQTIIRICEALKDLYLIPLLYEAISVIGILISCLYVMSLEPLLSLEAYGRFQYALALFWQLSLYCFYACEITNSALLVTEGIYFMKWYSCTKSIKSILVFNTMRMQRTIEFTVGKFAPLNLTTYLQILKGTYTYYTFLSKKGQM
ncbi:PREDICTED: odorant receptor 67c-like [Nicrophorus vespilloides]|uniref:Odorant receptor n=1 Tax=Nicrophorus vespilloides TaxID=110193 RepID=A0ABM1MFV6_NICVS|nr:PREDICTED: odorant receptor 67c-like [Nicrophorus vespilloides]